MVPMYNSCADMCIRPPGTGKTKTIVAMVGALMSNHLQTPVGQAVRPLKSIPNNPASAPKKLFVCAPSNAAVDELVLRLKQGVTTIHGTHHQIKVLRLGRSEAINAAVKDVTLDELVRVRLEGDTTREDAKAARDKMHADAAAIKNKLQELKPRLDEARSAGDRNVYQALQRDFDVLKRDQLAIGAKIEADKDSGNTSAREAEIRRRQIQQEILDSAQVLCATLSGSGHEMFKNLNVEFETVIIDEAAQCVELSALIPLKYGCTKCILVGDPKQLPPTVLSQSAAKYGYDQSLFVRMQQNHPDHIHLLDTQYRMHPEISQFPSSEFYESRLVDGENMGALRRQPWHQSSLLGPYRFFDVKGIQEKGQKGQSLVNVEELKVAMQLYERFRSDYREAAAKVKIGIITPYKAQLHELRNRFSMRYGNSIVDEVEFNTTDAFQGRECEIIIFSCVRASPTGGIGFMTDIRRMNVGLTRAKSSLWILGDSRALVQGEFWAKLIVNAKERGRYTDGDILSTLRNPLARDAVSASRVLSGAPPPPLIQELDIRGSSEQYKRPQTKPIQQLPATYTVLERPQQPWEDAKKIEGLNERGEANPPSRRTSTVPIIQSSAPLDQGPRSKKRHRDANDVGGSRVESKRVCYNTPRKSIGVQYLTNSLLAGERSDSK
jgi:senataxin